MSLQIMESAESHLAFSANERFFLAMGQEVTLEIMVACKLSAAIRTLMFLATR